MKRKIVAGAVALLVAVICLYVLLRPNALNFIPYLIYTNFFERVNENGEIISSISEQSIIVAFDVLLSVFVFWIVFKLLIRGLIGKVF